MGARGWTALFVAALTLPACATGGTIDPRGNGDGGRPAGDASSSDASTGVDARISIDATIPTDATATGGDGGTVDAGLRDAGPRDAGGTDAGMRDAGCPAGATMSCTSSCGTIGTSSCSGGAWSACAPPSESCNDVDDDCDGTPDDGFACRRGSSGSCTTSCGSTGSRTCTSSCAWASCSAPAEVCDGRDQDCDGAVDEGSRATVLRVSYAADLAPRHASCDGSTQRIGQDCNAAIHRYCAARGCSTSGFGPDESSGDPLDITCVVADVRNTTIATLATHHAGCTGGWTPECNAAVHRYCGSLGFPSGFGPVEQAAGNAAIACVASASVISTTFTTLRTHHPGCDGATQRMGPECNAAIHRFCGSSGYTSGYGPVENSGDTAYVTCVRN